MPLPNWQPLLAITRKAGWAAGAVVAASPGAADPARAKPPKSEAHPLMATALPVIHRLRLCFGMNSSSSNRPPSAGAGDPAGDPRAAALTPGDGDKTARPTLRVPRRARR